MNTAYKYRLEARDDDGEVIGIRERSIVEGTTKEHDRIWRAWRTWVDKNCPDWCEIEIFGIDEKGERVTIVFKD